MRVTDNFSGKRKFFKGRGRKGKRSLDDYQQMLLEAEKTNGFEHELKQEPLSKKRLKQLGYIK